MEKGFNSWSQDHQIGWQSPNPNLPSAQFGLGPRVMFPSFGNVVSPPVIHEPHGWFYGLPRHRQAFDFAPMVNSMAKEVKETLQEASPVVAREMGQKKFLVFDQSGDQTTLMYGFGVGPSSTRYQFPSLNKPKPQDGSHAVCVDNIIQENNGSYSESEMREDTEELNALLYSDDEEDDDEDDEDDETSTGHSPNSLTGFEGQKREFESGEEEEVASSGGAWKRCKKEDKGSFVNSLEDTASSSGKSGINCSANEVFEEEEYDSFSSGNKKLRIEKIKETINLLQNLIPGDTSGKNAILVIDEAIHYLTSLKVKAKALGLDSF